uniref:RabBD domain-containing protein n=1 Tax=Elaeophora elaphi TaxID=1147741 RepID=A0A0R3RQ46_9BILA
MLKTGWSVRTASARSPTNTRKNGITDSEKKHITAVLARAEERRVREQQRIGRMIDRLEKMKARATGNGITQCYICSTDFGLLASRSYAAMCLQCRRYVCQKNCGVEAYDCARRENIFLCKICSEYREVMWKKSGAWFYKEIPEYIRPVEDLELHSPLSRYPKTSWQHYTKPETSNLTYLTDKLQQSRKERYSSTAFNRSRINPSWLHQKVRQSLSNGDGSEEENAENSASEETEAFSKGNLQLAQSVTSNRHIRIPKRKEAQEVPIVHRFTVGGRSRITDTEGSESHHATPSTSPRHSPSSYGDDLSQNQSSILASESIDSGVVPSDHSMRVSKIHASAETVNPTMTMSDHADESCRLIRHSNCSRTLSSSSGIQKTLLSSEMHTNLEQEIPPQVDGKKCFFPAQQASKSSKKAPGSKDILLESQFKKIFPLMLFTNEPSPSAASQPSQQDQFSAFSSTHTSSPSSPAGTTVAAGLTKQLAPNQEPAASSASSTSSARKSVMSLESLPANLEQIKTVKVQMWQHKSGIAMQLPMKGLSTTRSAVCLQSSVATEVMLRGQAVVRHAISGHDIINLQDSDTDVLGSIQFTLRYSAQQMKLRVRLTGAKNLRAMDKNGFSDPYVKLYLIPGASKATKMVSKTIEKTLNPLWNEEFTYYGITDEDHLKKSLRLLVLDRDRIGSDFLGEIRVPLKNLKDEEETFYNVRLEEEMLEQGVDINNERGKICLSLLYNVQQGSLYVTIKRCAELLGMDKTGFSDPYVKVSLLPLTNKAHRQKTSTKKRTLNPEFNETLTFVIPFKDLPKKTLQVDVFDKDVGMHDDYIGGVLLSTSAKGEREKQWNSCIQNPGYEFEQWHKLEFIE